MLQTPPPRGPRGSSPQVRGRGRGGIQKRRAGGPVRVDRDGDLVMDAAAAPGDKPRSGRGRIAVPNKPAGSGRAHSGPSRGGHLGVQKAQQAILRGIGAKQAIVRESRVVEGGTRLQIDGLSSSKAAANSDGGLESLLAFLERKASGLDAKSNRAVKIKKSSRIGDSVFITASPEDIADIQKLDNFSFAGATLSIKPCESASPTGKLGKKTEVSPKALEVKDQFRAILATRYDVGLKLLNLSSLATDAGLREMGVFDGSTNTSKVFPALMVVCDELFKTRQAKREAIVSVTLADNGLADVTDVTALATTFPDIHNLDLSRNKIAELKSIDAWRWKFRSLENLVLTGNPIEAQLVTLKDEILRRYPRLHTLNNVQVRTPEELAAILAAAEAAKSPIPITTADFRDVGQVGENFIRQFLALYDTDRANLLATYYDSESVHSIAINMTAPRSTQLTVPVQPWAEYTKHSRNLVKVNHLSARMNRRYKGIQAIQPIWSSLPATRHPDLQTQGDKYIIECHSLPGLTDPSGQSPRGVDGLIITMHGEFEEQTTTNTEKSLRSFSRTFVLGPGGAAGPPIRVVSDMVALRAWAPLPQPQTSKSPLPTSIPSTLQAQSSGNMEQQNQEALAMQLMEKTGMTMQYAGLCLTETGWDLARAFAAFEANKDKLPADAFVAGVAR